MFPRWRVVTDVTGKGKYKLSHDHDWVWWYSGSTSPRDRRKHKRTLQQRNIELLKLKTKKTNGDADELVLEANVGESAVLPCKIYPVEADDKLTLILWYKDDSKDPIYSYDARLNGHPEERHHLKDNTGLGGRVHFHHSRGPPDPHSLTISRLSIRDSGHYLCRGDFAFAQSQTRSLVLKVVAPIESLLITDAQDRPVPLTLPAVAESGTLNLTCTARGGHPAPAVTWWIGDKEIDDSWEEVAAGVVANTLVLSPLTRQHAHATLTCRAQNSRAYIENTTVVIDMYLRPRTMTIEAVGMWAGQAVRMGQQVEFTCTTHGSRPTPIITWYKGAQLLHTDEHPKPDRSGKGHVSHLTLTLEKGDNKARLACRVSNPTLPHHVLHKFITLNVTYPPSVSLRVGKQLKSPVVKEGSDLYLTCHVDANPEPHTLAFLHEGHEVSHNTSAGVIVGVRDLVLGGIRRGQAGAYTCRATNTEGAGSSASLNITVLYAPVCAGVHQTWASPGSRVKASCRVQAAPPTPVTFSWVWVTPTYSRRIASAHVSSEGDTSTVDFNIPRDNRITDVERSSSSPSTSSSSSSAPSAASSLPASSSSSASLSPLSSTSVTAAATPFSPTTHTSLLHSSGAKHGMSTGRHTRAQILGTLQCWAENNVGRMEVPCAAPVRRPVPPSAPDNCTLIRPHGDDRDTATSLSSRSSSNSLLFHQMRKPQHHWASDEVWVEKKTQHLDATNSLPWEPSTWETSSSTPNSWVEQQLRQQQWSSLTSSPVGGPSPSSSASSSSPLPSSSYSSEWVAVQCHAGSEEELAGWAGKVVYVLEVYEAETKRLLLNLTNNKPRFVIRSGLVDGRELSLFVSAHSPYGSSHHHRLNTLTFKTAENRMRSAKHSFPWPIAVVFVCAVTVAVVAIIIVVALVRLRVSRSRHKCSARAAVVTNTGSAELELEDENDDKTSLHSSSDVGMDVSTNTATTTAAAPATASHHLLKDLNNPSIQNSLIVLHDQQHQHPSSSPTPASSSSTAPNVSSSSAEAVHCLPSSRNPHEDARKMDMGVDMGQVEMQVLEDELGGRRPFVWSPSREGDEVDGGSAPRQMGDVTLLDIHKPSQCDHSLNIPSSQALLQNTTPMMPLQGGQGRSFATMVVPREPSNAGMWTPRQHSASSMSIKQMFTKDASLLGSSPPSPAPPSPLEVVRRGSYSHNPYSDSEDNLRCPSRGSTIESHLASSTESGMGSPFWYRSLPRRPTYPQKSTTSQLMTKLQDSSEADLGIQYRSLDRRQLRSGRLPSHQGEGGAGNSQDPSVPHGIQRQRPVSGTFSANAEASGGPYLNYASLTHLPDEKHFHVLKDKDEDTKSARQNQCFV